MPTVTDSLSQFALVLWLVLLLATLALAGWVFRLHRQLRQAIGHYRSLAAGAEGANLEEVLNNHLLRVRNNSAMVADLRSEVQRLGVVLDQCIQRVGFVRFNPFHHTGSDQSFAIALLDAAGTGIVVSSLFSREGMRIYAKPLQRGRSPYPLTEEEEEAIRRAQANGSLSRIEDLLTKGGGA